jgi:hypothetical protein
MGTTGSVPQLIVKVGEETLATVEIMMSTQDYIQENDSAWFNLSHRSADKRP